jgi:hypothetical protein
MFGLGPTPRVAAALALTLAVSAARSAAACGGCFGPPTSPTLVTGHRMAFAISETQTVLWDQFQYQGNPEDFSWVLPVRPGAYVEVADDAWLATLDAFTSPTVIPPQLNCSSSASGGGCSCGSMAASSDDGRGLSADSPSAGPPGVQVVRRERVGPYETVVLRSEDPEALEDWLTVNGYSIPDEIYPVIDAYVDEGNDFLALRLAPEVGVEQMEPVRVITPGGDYLLPLRMVAAGVGSYVKVVLFVIAEGRYTMPDMAEVNIDERKLEYDFLSGSHNYTALHDAALAQNAGKSAIVPYARAQAFHTENVRPDLGAALRYGVADKNGVVSSAPSTLSQLYFAQASVDRGGSSMPNCTPPLGDTRLVVRACSANEPCQPPGPNEIPSSSFVCGMSSDLATSLIGMHPDKVWVTRFDLNLPSTALDADCVVSPAVADVEVKPFLDPKKIKNPPCAPALFSAGTGSLLLGLWASSALLARRRKRALKRC